MILLKYYDKIIKGGNYYRILATKTNAITTT